MMYVLHVQSGFELQVMQELLKKGYKAVVPRHIKLERQKSQWKEKERLLIPSYVFVSLCFNDKVYYDIKSIPHIIRFLGNTYPSALPDEEAEYIRWLTKDNIIKPSTIQIFESGRYRPVLGLLADSNIKIQSLDIRQKRVKAEISLFGKKIVLQLSAYMMEALI